MSPLQIAIESLYQAFINVRSPQHIDGCPCCTNEAELTKLAATPRRAISPEDLSRYAAKAMTTIGGVEHFLYFLPRILEVTAFDPDWWPCIEASASRIRDSGLSGWPIHRQIAFDTFLRAVVDSRLATEQYDQLDGWLCAIALMGLDVTSYLTRFEKNKAAVLQYFDDNSLTLREGRLRNGFWKLPNSGHDAIVRWFQSDAIRKIAFDAYGCTF